MILQKGSAPNIITAPLTQDQIDALLPCQLVNPMHGKQNGFMLPDEYSDPNAMMDMAREVDAAVNMAARGKFDAEGFAKYWPAEWGDFDDSQINAFVTKGMLNMQPVTLAENVKMDQATEFYNVMHGWVMANGYRLKGNTEQYVDFLGHNFGDAAHVMNLCEQTMTQCFEIKSYNLVARPESWLNAEMTLYDSGAPCHGECLSGHTTAAFTQAMSFITRYDMDKEGKLMLLRMAWHIANSRTIAGVHFYRTNFETMKWVMSRFFNHTVESVLTE